MFKFGNEINLSGTRAGTTVEGQAQARQHL